LSVGSQQLVEIARALAIGCRVLVLNEPKSASLTLRRGEVLGIAGLVGAGRTELLRSIFGLAPVRKDRIKLGIYTGPASPRRRWMHGAGLLSEDRKEEGPATISFRPKSTII